jgi:hypothetical protein
MSCKTLRSDTNTCACLLLSEHLAHRTSHIAHISLRRSPSLQHNVPLIESRQVQSEAGACNSGKDPARDKTNGWKHGKAWRVVWQCRARLDMGLGWKRNGCLGAPSTKMRQRRKVPQTLVIPPRTRSAAVRSIDVMIIAVKTCAGTSLPCFVAGVAVRLTGVHFDYWCSMAMTPAIVWRPWASQVVPAQSEQWQAHEP